MLRLLADVGDACDFYMDQNARGLRSERIQCDEIWSFCHVKECNLPVEMRGADGVGDLWTWTAIDADTKLIVTWHLGKRTRGDATYSFATCQRALFRSVFKSRLMGSARTTIQFSAIFTIVPTTAPR